jgi:hypothetical protein
MKISEVVEFLQQLPQNDDVTVMCNKLQHRDSVTLLSLRISDDHIKNSRIDKMLKTDLLKALMSGNFVG